MTDGTGLGLTGEAWWGRLTEGERDTVRLLARLEQHTLLTKLGEALADVAQVVSQLHTPGVVSLKVKIEETEPGNPLIAIHAEVSKKMPVPKKLGQFTYYENGRFSEEDNRQVRLPLGRIIDGEEADNRAIITMRSERRVE
jgi:hypothetical protein